MLSITIIIILLTAIISFSAFYNQKIMNDLIFYPPSVSNSQQWYRFITSGFIHADFMHLAFNMYSFYLFGEIVENAFAMIFAEKAKLIFILLYLSALVVSLLPTYIKHREDRHYLSLGASGAVSAIVFAGIFLYPTLGMGIFPIPFHIPGFIFGPLYIGISYYLANKGQGNINHSAHIWGAVYGIVYLIICSVFLSRYNLTKNFLEQVLGYLQ